MESAQCMPLCNFMSLVSHGTNVTCLVIIVNMLTAGHRTLDIGQRTLQVILYSVHWTDSYRDTRRWCYSVASVLCQRFWTRSCVGADNWKYHELYPEHGGLPRTTDVLAYLARQRRTRKDEGMVPGPDPDHRPADWRKVGYEDMTFHCCQRLT